MKKSRVLSSQVVVGIVLILAGICIFLSNSGFIHLGPIWRFWPLILIGIGLARIFGGVSRASQGSGIMLLILGLWFQTIVLNLWGLTMSDTWPVVILAIGASMLWKSFPPRTSITSQREETHA